MPKTIDRRPTQGPAPCEENSHPLADQLQSPGLSAKTLAELFTSRTSAISLHDEVYVDRWIQRMMKLVRIQAVFVSLRDVEGWLFDKTTGNIGHGSGRFFTITGVEAHHRTNKGEIKWDQPILDQPEIGILGIMTRKFEGVSHFCLHAKEEPGNINGIQLSPTVQATHSNYTRVHGGSLPPFVELFLDPPRKDILFSKLQTDDGGRFLFKSNRNMVIRVDDVVKDLPEDFIWLTLRQISALMGRDNLINACARSVLACLL